MKRIAVILITAAATVAILGAAVAVVFGVHEAGGSEGYLLLHSKQSAECRDGGGCAVYSVREMKAMVTAALEHGYVAGSRSQRDDGL